MDSQQQHQQQYQQQYQQQQEQYPQQHQQQQQNVAPTHPQQTYQQPVTSNEHIQPQQTYHPVTSNEHIQPLQQAHTDQQALPPSYDQAKAHGAAPAGQQAQGVNPNVPATVIPLNMLGDQPQYIDCPFCHQRSTTIVQREGTSMQIVVGAILCLFCVCLTCVPCLAGWFEDTEYRCAHCKNMVAVRRHDGPIEVFGPTVPVYSQYNGNQAPMNAQQQHDQPKDGQVPQQNYQQQQQQSHQPQYHQPQHDQYQQQQQQPQQQQHQEQYPMHQLQPQVQQQQQPVTTPDAKN